MKNTKIKILVCCHKSSQIPEDDIFFPIQAGKELSTLSLPIQHDNELFNSPCDNISAKNASFCELTAVYWAWKNIKKIYPDLEYIGLNHYRRYFSFDESNFIIDQIIKPEKELFKYKINHKKLNNYLRKDFIILPKPHLQKNSLYDQYCISHNSEDMRDVQKIIHELNPEYDDVFYNALKRKNRGSFFNIFIMSWNDFDSYCKWLFDILFESEKRINISNYKPYQQRVFGFLAERLFNVWLYKNKKKKKYLNIICFADVTDKKNILKELFGNIRNILLFPLSRPIKKHYRYEE